MAVGFFCVHADKDDDGRGDEDGRDCTCWDQVHHGRLQQYGLPQHWQGQGKSQEQER